MKNTVYGIDLGTTNTLISRYKDGFISPLIPSIVDLEHHKAGEELRHNYNTLRSFKINISMSLEGNASVAASRYVLEECIHAVKDDKVKDVVISVPAYFSDNQRSATKEAARLAGLNVLRLVPEPTAAALYISQERKCLALVCDLGGGTFDVSAIDSRFGDYYVLGKDGLILGGDDFDKALEQHIIKLANIRMFTYGKQVPQKMAELKDIVSEAKIKLQKTRSDVTIPLYQFGVGEVILTVENYISIMKLTFAKTITLMRDLIAKCGIETEGFELFMVGGSTHCPYYREWVAKELGTEPAPLTYDPDRVVSQGAALYAHLIEEGKIDAMVSDVTSGIAIEMADGTLNYIIPDNSTVPIRQEQMCYNSVDSSFLELKLFQGKSLLPEGNECIGTMKYAYSQFMEAGEGVVYITVEVSSSGIVKLSCREALGNEVDIIIDRTQSKVRK